MLHALTKTASPLGPLSIRNGEGTNWSQVPLSNSVGEGDLGGEARNDSLKFLIKQLVRGIIPPIS
jgi:hypothetical protein